MPDIILLLSVMYFSLSILSALFPAFTLVMLVSVVIVVVLDKK